jgi:quercetin dioxygenase-like cupin family protein
LPLTVSRRSVAHYTSSDDARLCWSVGSWCVTAYDQPTADKDVTETGMKFRAARTTEPRLTSRIDLLTLPLAPDEKTGYRFYGQYRGATANVGLLSCHASALASGHSPHPPHSHPEEEILMMLEGEGDLILPELSPGRGTFRLQPGEFVYYPAHFPHTLRAASREPANYLMFKWRDNSMLRNGRLSFGRFDLSEFAAAPDSATGCHFGLVFEGATRWLSKLHAHLTTLAPSAGYEPHVDLHDVAIVVLKGEVETLGRRVGKHGVIYFAAGDPHGMRNPGPEAAQYVAFEFHGVAPLWRTLTDLTRWQRRLARTVSQ